MLTEVASQLRSLDSSSLSKSNTNIQLPCSEEITNVDNSPPSSTSEPNVFFDTKIGLAKYDQEVYDTVMDLFDNLPLSAIINNKFLCIHGGISTDIHSVTQH